MLARLSAISLVLFALCAAPLARAQDPAISIPARIEQGSCSKVPSFKPTLDGKPARVSTKMGPGSDQIILIVLDLTGSLSRIDAAEQALTADISKMPKNTWIGLLRAQDGLHVLADPSPNREKVIHDINSLTTTGTPGFLQTVRMALSLANGMVRKSRARVAVFYLTDGSIYSYQEDYTDPVVNPSDHNDLSRRFPDVLINEKISKLKRHISSLEAPLFVVQLHYRGDNLDEAYQNGIESLANATGGEAVMCRSLAEVPQVISNMFHEIRNTWRLTLAVPPKSRGHVQVGLRAYCGSGDLQISWRTHFHLKGE